ncbi:hypothetical protein BASA81_007892 [Batrachochytrium salamandrivorans]|nr:hypothetical protein BASA81_007892 [Batrachochytrium salamandrivorans]
MQFRRVGKLHSPHLLWMNTQRPRQTPPHQQASFATWWKKPQIDQGVQAGKVVLGKYHVTKKDLGFVRQSAATTAARDILIQGVDYRNRAMDGDLVAVELLQTPPPSSTAKSSKPAPAPTTLTHSRPNLLAESNDALWCPTEHTVQPAKPSTTSALPPIAVDASQPVGRVVAVLDPKTMQVAQGPKLNHELVGTLQLPSDANWKPGSRFPANAAYSFLQTDDPKTPSLVVLRQNLPQEFLDNPMEQKHTLYRAKMDSWPEGKKLPFGAILGRVGTRGEIYSETLALLLKNNVSLAEWSPEAMACVPSKAEFEISPQDLKERRDLRSELVFTIDPPTAKDIDDALHCKQVGADEYEVGVHIADVSHFVQPGTALDVEASQRCTSVYLVQKCLPMLPPMLSEELCSLNPHCDRLAFSVIWRMNSKGELVNTTPVWFGKSIIRSDCKLDYPLAHSIVTTGAWTSQDPTRQPELFTKSQVKTALDAMVKIGMNRRKLRFDPERGGALNLTQYKLSFELDSKTGNPVGVKQYPIYETNQLVEEFMLLCNFLVAQRLLQGDVRKAFIRHHPPPELSSLDKVFKVLGVDPKSVCEATDGGVSAGMLQRYLARVQQGGDETVLLVVREMLKKPMKLAKYAVSGDLAADKLRHWALNIRYYTHFTSPIRRYADLIVHRQLQALLVGGEESEKSGPPLAWYQTIAERCNEKKEEAKTASEDSDELYLNLYCQQRFQQKQAFHGTAVVVELGAKSIQLLMPEYGINKRVHVENELGWKVIRCQGNPASTPNSNGGDEDEEEAGAIEVQYLQVETKSGELMDLRFLTKLHVALVPLTNGKLGFKMVSLGEVEYK